jgi:hypothetical protein
LCLFAAGGQGGDFDFVSSVAQLRPSLTATDVHVRNAYRQKRFICRYKHSRAFNMTDTSM